MEMRWAPARSRPRRRADQPSFSSTLLDAICDSMDDPSAPRPPPPPPPKKKQQDAALHYYYYYKPSLAASHRARAAPPPAGASPGDCPGRGYFSSSELECSLRRLRPIRTSAAPGGAGAGLPPQRQHPAASEKARAAKSPAASARGGCRSRPASPGARLASLLNSIFTGKRASAPRQAAPADQEPACSTVPSYARSCLAKAPPLARPRASRSRSARTVRFLDIDGQVAVAAAAVGRCRRIPVVEVEEVLLRPVDAQADSDGGGEESSDASSDLFELEDLAAIAPSSGGAYGDELPVYGTTGVGFRRGIGHSRLHGYDLGRSCRKVI